jgi:hypothetical protein
MVRLGYKLMSEEHGPIELVRNAKRAEEAGFDFAAISDHFFPWIEEQGHAPLAWSVLGAVANATKRLGLMTAVTCPTMRYHPAIIAQGAATLALLSGDRFTLGLGAGERLNEHITGEGWPGVVERQARLVEAIDIIQGLLVGSLTNYRGSHFRLDQAKLFDRPERKPPIVIAAGGAAAARLAATKADALMVTEPRADPSPMNFSSALRAIRSVLAGRPDVYIVNEGANTLDFGRNIIDMHEPRHRLDSGTWGVMGIGMGYAIGAAVVTGKPVVAIVGDSAFGFCGMEIETICRYQLPVVTVIFNNSGIYRGDAVGSPYSPTGLMHNARYDKMIEAFGGAGYHVTDAPSLTKAVSEALAVRKPALINAVIDPTAGTESGHIRNLNPKSELADKT